MYPELDEGAPLPPGSFITCSSDNTVRVWNIDTGQTLNHKNIYSEELLKVIYADEDLTSIMNDEYNPGRLLLMVFVVTPITMSYTIAKF